MRKPISSCINCGAPLKGVKCVYCDTVYDPSPIDAYKVNVVAQSGTITTEKETIQVYLGDVVAHNVYDDGVHVAIKRVFTFIEF